MMCNTCKKAFTLIEIMTAVAIVGILAAALLSVSKHIRTQARNSLAQGTIDIIVSAVEQYYDQKGEFPLNNGAAPYDPGPPVTGFRGTDLKAELEGHLGGSLTVTLPAGHRDEYASSEALFYFLDTVTNSRKLVGSISETLLTAKNDKNKHLVATVSNGDKIDLVRFIDPWGHTLRYTYIAGNNFPVIESAGPDGEFDTEGDNITSR